MSESRFKSLCKVIYQECKDLGLPALFSYPSPSYGRFSGKLFLTFDDMSQLNLYRLASKFVDGFVWKDTKLEIGYFLKHGSVDWGDTYCGCVDHPYENATRS